MKNDPATLLINACYMPLAFLYGLCRVRVSIDEQRFTQAFGEQDYQLSSGMHRVAVHFRYCFLPMGNASVDIQVEAGSALRLRYDAPLWVFGSGELNEEVDLRA